MNKTARLLKSLGLCLLALASLSACSTAHLAPDEAAFPKIVVAPFTIIPDTLGGEGTSQPRQDVFVALLGDEATASAVRTLLLEKIGGTVQSVPSFTQAAGQITVTGTVTLPVSLPPGVDGLRADSRKGRLALVTLELLDSNGKMLRTAEAEISWRQARWLRGAPRFRRAQPTAGVLRETVREGVVEAVRRLKS